MESLKGKLLVATPEMDDERFSETVIYMLSHDEDGAMGLVINRPLTKMNFADVLDDLNIETSDEADSTVHAGTVLNGGPVEKGRGFVLHTDDYIMSAATYVVEDGIALTGNMEILRAIANGDGPKKRILALGYCGWDKGQLESELSKNGWIFGDASYELLFSVEYIKRYDAALESFGISRATLSPYAGSA